MRRDTTDTHHSGVTQVTQGQTFIEGRKAALQILALQHRVLQIDVRHIPPVPVTSPHMSLSRDQHVLCPFPLRPHALPIFTFSLRPHAFPIFTFPLRPHAPPIFTFPLRPQAVFIFTFSLRSHVLPISHRTNPLPSHGACTCCPFFTPLAHVALKRKK